MAHVVRPILFSTLLLSFLCFALSGTALPWEEEGVGVVLFSSLAFLPLGS